MIKNLFIYLKNNPSEFLNLIILFIIPFILKFIYLIINTRLESLRLEQQRKDSIKSEIHSLQVIMNTIKNSIITCNINFIDEDEFLNINKSYANALNYPKLIKRLKINFDSKKLDEIDFKNSLLFDGEKISNIIILETVINLYNDINTLIKDYNENLLNLESEFGIVSSYNEISGNIYSQYESYKNIHNKIKNFFIFIINNIDNLQILLNIIYEGEDVDIFNEDRLLDYLSKYDL